MQTYSIKILRHSPQATLSRFSVRS